MANFKTLFYSINKLLYIGILLLTLTSNTLSLKKAYTIKFYLSNENSYHIPNSTLNSSIFSENNINYYFKHNLITHVCVGNPRKCLKTELSFSSKQTWFCCESNNTSFEKKMKNLYQPEKSTSFKKLNQSKEIETSDGVVCGNYSQDIIKIGNNNNNNKPLFFYITDNCTSHKNNSSSGELGLGEEYEFPYDISSTSSESLIDQLKKIEIIKTSIIRIKYFNDTYGEVALGADYKNLNKIKMKFFDLPMVNYSSIISAFVKNLYITKDVLINEENEISENKEKKVKIEFYNKLRIKIDFTSSFITLPEEVFDRLIDTSFNKYINNKKLCEIKKDEDRDIKYLICDQIILNTKLDRLVFEIDWKTNIEIELSDLFIVKRYKSKYIILGIISQHNLKYLCLGDIFLKNFVIFLDNDNKLIRFYNKRNFKEIYDYKKEVALIIVICLILIIVLFYMLKVVCERSKIETECPPDVKKFLNKDFDAYENANKIMKTYYRRFKKKPRYHTYYGSCGLDFKKGGLSA